VCICFCFGFVCASCWLYFVVIYCYVARLLLLPTFVRLPDSEHHAHASRQFNQHSARPHYLSCPSVCPSVRLSQTVHCHVVVARLADYLIVNMMQMLAVNSINTLLGRITCLARPSVRPSVRLSQTVRCHVVVVSSVCRTIWYEHDAHASRQFYQHSTRPHYLSCPSVRLSVCHKLCVVTLS